MVIQAIMGTHSGRLHGLSGRGFDKRKLGGEKKEKNSEVVLRMGVGQPEIEGGTRTVSTVSHMKHENPLW